MNILSGKLTEALRKIGRGENGVANLVPMLIGGVSTVALGGALAAGIMRSGSGASQSVDAAVHDAIQNQQGSIMLEGSVIAKAATTGSNGTVGQIIFPVVLITSGGSVDFTPPAPDPNNTGLADPETSNNVLVVSYTDKYQHVDNLYWTLNRIKGKDDNNILTGGEMFQVIVGGSPTPGTKGGNLVNALGKGLSTNTEFEITVHTAQGRGGALTLQRSTPSRLENTIDFGY